MGGCICFSINRDCKNFLDSCGEICVGCNACGRINKKTKHRDRLAVELIHQQENLNFDRWADEPELRSRQEQVTQENIIYYDKLIAKLKVSAEKERIAYPDI